MKILFLAPLREALHRPTLSLLSILGVALGVATVVAVDIANNSARSSFLAANRALSGSATHRLEGHLTDHFYGQLRLGGYTNIAPVVKGKVQIGSQETQNTATLYGIDGLRYLNQRNSSQYSSWQGLNRSILPAFLGHPLAVAITQETARTLDVKINDKIQVYSPVGLLELPVLGFIQTHDPLERQALHSTLVCDIATAQAVLGMRGKLSTIHLNISDEKEENEIRSLLPPNIHLESFAQHMSGQDELTQAFHANLTAFSFIALLVAIFLVYNTMLFLVSRRRQRIGITRTLGVTRREELLHILLEILAIGAIATTLGLALGIQLAELLLSHVEQTIDNLYFPINAGITIISPQTTITAILLGLVVSCVSAIPALKQILFKSSLSNLYRAQERGPAPKGIRSMVLPLIFFTSAIVLFAIGPQNTNLLFAAVILLIAGYILSLIPLVGVAIAYIRPMAKSFLGIRAVLATRAFHSTQGRTSVAILAICVSIAAVIGMGTMISSFRSTVEQWLGNVLDGDIYIQREAGLDQDKINLLHKLPSIKSLRMYKNTTLYSPFGSVPIEVSGIGQEGFAAYQLKDADSNQAWRKFLEGGIMVSESFAWKNSLTVGSTLKLGRGTRLFEYPVVAINYNYSPKIGAVTLHRKTYRRDFDDQTINKLILLGQPNIDQASLLHEVKQILGVPFPGLKIWQNRKLRQSALNVFDQTFEVVGVLKTMAIIISFIAVWSALMAIQIERERELAVMRAMGFTSRGIGVLVTLETALMGLIAALLALPLGLVMAKLFTWVIGQKSFGWTIHMQFDPGFFLQVIALSCTAALIAGLIPAWKISTYRPAMALKALE